MEARVATLNGMVASLLAPPLGYRPGEAIAADTVRPDEVADARPDDRTSTDDPPGELAAASGTRDVAATPLRAELAAASGTRDVTATPLDLRAELAALHDASFAWAMCCCRFARSEAEDALHLAYMKVLDGRAHFGGRSPFRTWLFGVIRNTARSVRRRELARRILTGRVVVDAFASPPDELVAAARDRADVRRALGELSERQRETLELVVHHGLTLDEAAEVLAISPGTARTHYERGKAALRASLAPTRSS